MPVSQLSIFKSLLRSDFTVQWRNKRSPAMASILALVMLVSLKQTAHQSAGPHWYITLLGVSLSIVLTGMGVLGYPTIVARDRDRGVFRRLRTTPANGWTIMLSRLCVQLVVMGGLACIVLAAGALFNQMALTPMQYISTVLASVLCGTVYLAIGQTLVGLIASSDTLNAVGRVIYFSIALAGSIIALGALGKTAASIAEWSPYGTVQSVLQAAMQGAWNSHAWSALGLTLAYTLFFVALGIKWFRWDAKH